MIGMSCTTTWVTESNNLGIVISKRPTWSIISKRRLVILGDAIHVPLTITAETLPVSVSVNLPRVSLIIAFVPRLISDKVETRVAPVPTLCFSKKAMIHFVLGACGFLLAPSYK